MLVLLMAAKILAVKAGMSIEQACLPCLVSTTSTLVEVDFLQTNKP
jgi:hypothetical protein